MRTGTQITGYTQDKVIRDRFSLSHEYNNEKGWLQYAKTQVFYQDAKTENYRYRLGTRSYRQENTKFSDKSYGLVSNLISVIDGNIPQVLRYGLSYVHNKASDDIHLVRPAYRQITNMYPMAEMQQDKFTGYLEDEMAFGNFAITPQLGFVHYRVNQYLMIIELLNCTLVSNPRPNLRQKLAWNIDCPIISFLIYNIPVVLERHQHSS